MQIKSADIIVMLFHSYQWAAEVITEPAVTQSLWPKVPSFGIFTHPVYLLFAVMPWYPYRSKAVTKQNCCLIVIQGLE